MANPIPYRWVCCSLVISFTVVSAAVAAVTESGRHGRIDVTPRPVATISPGTIIREEAPKGWSHLVIKSGSRIGAGDVERLSAAEQKYARLFSTVIVADVDRRKEVEGDGPRFVLARIAVGCLTSIDRNDTVVSPDSHKQLGADLGFLGGMLLGEICKKQQEVLVVARSGATAIIDAPVVVRHKGENRPMVFRYALLLDEATGILQTLVWLHDPDLARGGNRDLPDTLQWLGENHVEEFPLHVDANHYKFGIPTDKVFGVMNLPHGEKQVDVPQDLRQLLGAANYDSTRFVMLEAQLRKLTAVNDLVEPTGKVGATEVVPLDARRAKLHEPVLRPDVRRP